MPLTDAPAAVDPTVDGTPPPNSEPAHEPAGGPLRLVRAALPMAVFTLRRLLQLLFTVIGGFLLLFTLFFALPSSPAEYLAGGGGRAVNPQVVRNIEKKYGFDKPLPQQFWTRLKETATLSGESYKTHEKVRDIVNERLPNSLRLAIFAIAIEITVGIGFGVLSAIRRNSVADWVSTTAAVVASAIPVFVLGFLLKQVTGVFANEHSWFHWAKLPTGGLGPDEWYLGIIPSPSQFWYVIQPAIILASVSTAIVARLTRSSMLEEANADHVRTARAKGLSDGQVTRRHILRNALVPVVTFVGVDFGTLVGFAILTETVFDWPGLGSKVASAAATRDLPVVLTLSTVVILIYGLASLAVDLSYAILDPRIRKGSSR